jgi:hypothetical protein
MKVYLSKYRSHWISPYTILEKTFFWREIDYDEPIIEKLSNILEPFCIAWMKFLDFIHPRIEYVKIDPWDVWNMDHTLSPIILPMLKRLREVKHGSGFVDMEDVPEHLRATTTDEWDSQHTFDFYNEDVPKEGVADIHARWNWVLDEMIFAFEHLVDDTWEEKFSSGTIDTIFVPCEDNPKLNRMEHGPNHTYVCDYDGLRKEYERIDNGLRLFGIYYRNLWD